MTFPAEGALKRCPRCGHQSAEFRMRTGVPGSAARGAGLDGVLVEALYVPAWSCQDLDCDYFEPVPQ